MIAPSKSRTPTEPKNSTKEALETKEQFDPTNHVPQAFRPEVFSACGLDHAAEPDSLTPKG